MVISKIKIEHNINIADETIEEVDKFICLCTIFSEVEMDEEIMERVGAEGRLFNNIKTSFLTKKDIPNNIKVEILKKMYL